MNMYKENKRKSKIPIPLDPLPPLPEKILQCQHSKNDRHPLETIYQEPGNVERSAANKKVVKVNSVRKRLRCILRNIDDRHVTIRQKTEKLDWDYKVFKDNEDGSGNVLEACRNKVDESKTSTPVLCSSLEPCRVKNIKRSLKRPHSRELQGVSPILKNEKDERKCRRHLDFGVHLERLLPSPDVSPNAFNPSLNKYDTDIFNYLLKKEVMQNKPKIATTARACVLNWLLKVNGPGGLPALVDTAAWLFDAMLTDDEIPLGKLQELAAACYWISLKQHGHFVSAHKLVRASCNAFTGHHLQSAERAVLMKLDFPVHPILPHDFISYMSWVCNPSNYIDIELAATIVYMASLIMNKVNSWSYPSVSGAAAVRNAVLLLNKPELLVILERNKIYKVATKKTDKFPLVCTFQRNAFRTMSSPFYEYNAIVQHYHDFIQAKIDNNARDF